MTSFGGVIFTIVHEGIPLVLSLGFLLFLWGVLMYNINRGDKEKRDEGINIMVLGTIIMFFAVTGWGIARYVYNQMVSVDTLTQYV